MRRSIQSIAYFSVIFTLILSLSIGSAGAVPPADPALQDVNEEEQVTCDYSGELTPLSTPESSGLYLSAQSALLMDGETGIVLYSYHANERSLIASITKIMTGLLVLEHCEDLDEVVTVSPDSVGVEGSSMYLEEGDQLTVRALLYGLMLKSGNDAASALAHYCAGNEEEFVVWMNARAASLGMHDTAFANPHGLNAQGHYSTAEDMAVLMRAALQNPRFREIMATEFIEIEGYAFRNHNKLLHLYPYCIAGKTGYTELAGRTLVSAAERNGQTLIAVTFNDTNDWNDHIAMFEYGFENYPTRTICREGEVFANVSVSGTDEPLPVLCTRTLKFVFSPTDVLSQQVYLPEKLWMSVEQGAVVGRIVYYVNGEYFGETFLEAARTVTVTEEGGQIQWNSDCKNFFPHMESSPDAVLSGTYRTVGLLWTVSSRPWG